MGRSLVRLLFLAAALLLAAGTGRAQPAPPAQSAEQAVRMFNVFCLSQLPDLEGVAKAAGFGEFAPVAETELEQYQTKPPSADLRAWRFHDQGSAYVLTAGTARPDDDVIRKSPKLAAAKSAACSLFIPASTPTEAVVAALTRVLGRGPDETFKDGRARVEWTQETAKALSRVNYSTPAGAPGQGILQASVFVLD